ncbi:MAG: AsmA family protein, partial [Verrucomicrobia bacterium]|nr:AsmA family protein [Cytophagales bacterium]
MLKKVIIGIVIFFVVLLALAFSLPIIFKDKIKAAIDTEIQKSVNARVYFSADKFGVSIFKHFPNITASLNDFGIVGKDDFEGDTLAAIPAFQVTVNVWDIIGGKINIKNVDLESPRIQVIALKNGKANWDIYKADTTQKTTDTASADVSFAIENWTLKNGYLVYDDRGLGFYTKLENLNHSGSGNFAKMIFDMKTQTTAEKLTLRYGGIEYLTDKKADVDMTLGMDLNNAKYTFKENTAKINDFAMGFDGFIAMPDTNIDMDITYKAQETDFKTLLSLMPGMYTKDFKDVKTAGNIKFDGYVKGRYNGKQLPGFGVNLLVNNAMFQYPSLPVPVNNINVDMKVDNPSGDLEMMLVDVKKFHLDLGKNPIDGRVLVKGLSKPTIDANILAKLNLAELMQIYPMKGLTLRGLFDLNLVAKGVYDTLTQQMPAINAKMALTNGFVKSDQFPAPLEQMNVMAEVINGTGKIPDTKVNISDFKMVLEGEPLQASAYIENFNDYTYDVKANGSVDFAKITKIFPLEGMTLTGKMKIENLATKGKMSDITAQRYDKLPTSGVVALNNFTFVSKDVPQGVKITEAHAEFSPKTVNLSKFEGFFGQSDVQMDGSLENYIAFILNKGTVKGNLSFNSKKFNINEWMTQNAVKDTTSAPMQLVEIPKNIDFKLSSSIGEVIYSNMDMKNVAGTIFVKNGIVSMEKVGFNMLGGTFTTSGKYDTQDLNKPNFAFDLSILDLGIQDAFKTFAAVKALMPLAESITGKFSVNHFNISGELLKNMMPKMNTLSGGGLITLVAAAIKNAPALTAVSNFTKIESLKNMQLANMFLTAQVKDGWVEYKPFDFDVQGYKVGVAKLRNNVDGNIDAVLKLDVPSGKVGALANDFVKNVLKTDVGADKNVQLDLGLGGTYKKPSVKLLGSSTTQAAKGAITAKLEEEKEKLKKQA